MQVVSRDFVSGKKVLLRYDIDVALKKSSVVSRQSSEEMEVAEDFKLRAGLETLKLCIENASKTVIIGHVGRPFVTVEDERGGNPPELSARPIHEWLEKELNLQVEFATTLEQVAQSKSKVTLLENIRFFHGEVPGLEYHTSCTSKTCDIDFAHKLASLADVYVNEAFSSHNPAASTTIVPTLLFHAAGVHFIKEVEKLTEVRNNPKIPFIAIMGGAKVKDKLPVIKVLAKHADAVLVGGKLVSEIHEQNIELPPNVLVAKLKEDGFDISSDTTEAWRGLIEKSAMIVWNGPLGKFEDSQNDQTKKIGEIITSTKAETIIGGGDIIAALNQAQLLDKISFVSVGGGAMLKFLSEGTLPTIESLK